MGYIQNYKTSYKVGDILQGKNSLKIKVIAVDATGAIDIQLINPHPGTAYYYFHGEYRTKVRKEPDKWLKMPKDGVLRNINMCTKVMFKVEHNTEQVKEISKTSWWGNKSGNKILYGCAPHGTYKIPGDKDQKVPNKTHTDDYWRKYYGLDSSWKMVPGSYQWSTTNNRNDYYGWRKEINTLHVRNHYAKRFCMKFKKGNNTLIESHYINIDKIKLPYKTYVPESIDAYVYRTAKKSTNQVTYPELKKVNFKDYVKLAPAPAINKFSIPDNGGNDILNFLWTSKEDEDDSKLAYSDVKVKFTDAYTGKVTEYTVKGSALTDKLTDPVPILVEGQPSGNLDLTKSRLAGKYEFTVTGIFDNKESQKTTESFIVVVTDDADAIPPVITDAKDNRIVYNMEKDITTLPHTPKWKVEPNHTYYATYDYYEYVDDGYDVVQKETQVEFKNGKTTFSGDGQYYITVIATYRNGKTASTTAFWMIDTRLPKAPIININGIDDYEGPFLKPERDKKIYLNSAVATIKSPVYTRNLIDIYFKKHSFGEFQRVGKNMLPQGGIFNRIGTWKIVVKAEKTEVRYPDGSGLQSIASEVIFAVKRKHTHDIELTTYQLHRENGYDPGIDNNDYNISYKAVPKEDEGLVKGYKVEANIKFIDNGLWDSGNLDMRYVLDEKGNKIKNQKGEYVMTVDYSGMDASSKLYRINGGDWRFYLDKIILYSNCTIECKSVDDDGFESYITTKEIKAIDLKSNPPIIRIPVLDELKGNGSSVIETGTTLRFG